MWLLSGHRHQWRFFAGRSCSESRAAATLSSRRGFGLDESKFHTWHLFWFCFLAAVQLCSVSEVDARVGYNWSIYAYVFMSYLCWGCGRLTLPQIIADIDIVNTAFIHTLLIRMHALFMHCIFMFEKWNDGLYDLWLLFLGQNYLRFISNLLWNMKHFDFKIYNLIFL